MGDRIVLLVEDDPSHEALFRRAVEQSGIPCRLDAVHDGVEAIEYLFATGSHEHRRHEGAPELILLDLRMPRMDGLQVLQVLRRVRGDPDTPHVPVVVITSSEYDRDIAEAYRLGAQSYLCKPTDFEEFAGAVRRTLAYWLDLNRPAPRRLATFAMVRPECLEVDHV
ncbi:MAG: response regulator [Pirellulales bacterium]|nr:response regulator [Pirellulales bacterium]